LLKKDAVVPEMYNLIKELQSNSLFNNCILAGGTALALQIGHRTSTDIDLFSSEIQNVESLSDFFYKNYKDVDIAIANDRFFRVYINKVKIELVYYEEKNIDKPIVEDNIKMFSMNEISAMKLRAIFGRSQPRDLIDIAFLLQYIPLREMFKLYKEKFGSISPLLMKRTLLIKSKNIKDDEWLTDIKMLRTDIKPEDVSKIIENAIDIYNKNASIGINK